MLLNTKIDQINQKILACLQQNARDSFVNIGRIVGLTAPAVADRVRRMEERGVIKGYHADVSHLHAGFQLKAVVMLRAFVGKLKPFLNKVESYPEVLSCYRVTGNDNIIMEVVLQDQLHLEKFIDQLILYGECRTHIVLSDVIANKALAIEN